MCQLFATVFNYIISDHDALLFFCAPPKLYAARYLIHGLADIGLHCDSKLFNVNTAVGVYIL